MSEPTIVLPINGLSGRAYFVEATPNYPLGLDPSDEEVRGTELQVFVVHIPPVMVAGGSSILLLSSMPSWARHTIDILRVSFSFLCASTYQWS